MKSILRVMSLAVLAPMLGCAGARGVLAEDTDLADYRAFRVAEREGERLRAAEDYLAAHPRGVFAPEVRAAHEAEEERFFERAKASRRGVRTYLGWLPRGPHAAAAQSLLEAYDARIEDEATARLLREARRTEATLAAAGAQRHAVGESILAAVAAFLDRRVYGRKLEDAQPALAAVLGGRAPATWAGVPRAHDQDLFYVVPATLERESRVVTLHVEVELEDGVVRGGRIRGQGLFVAWAEADGARPFDPTSPADRAAAAEHVVELLSGAFEATAPAARCRVPGTGEELFVRRCDGWEIEGRMGSDLGEPDEVRVRGPSPKP